MKQPLNILVLCTGNSARSVMTEALINVLGHGKFKAYSAGSQPTGKVNPFATEQVTQIGYDVSQLRSKSWNEFAEANAPQMDIVMTVCDSANNETCPQWLGEPLKIHWGFSDPSHVQGDEAVKRQAFEQTFALIRQHIEQLVSLPISDLTQQQLQQALHDIYSDRAQ